MEIYSSYSYLCESESTFKSNKPIWCHPWVRRYPRTIGAALGLSLLGFIFLWVGVATLRFDPMQALAFFITSFFTLVPGSYVCFYFYKAMKGHPEYSIASIPLFDE